MAKDKKVDNREDVLSIRLTTSQRGYISKLAEIIERDHGIKKNDSWVALRLMELGLPAFKSKYGVKDLKEK